MWVIAEVIAQFVVDRAEVGRYAKGADATHQVVAPRDATVILLVCDVEPAREEQLLCRLLDSSGAKDNSDEPSSRHRGNRTSYRIGGNVGPCTSLVPARRWQGEEIF